MAATVSHLPTFASLFSRNPFFSDPPRPQQSNQLRWTAGQHQPPPPQSALRASPVKKKSRKVKSNEELCNELREFLTAVGLPEGHFPSMKDLSQHGRKDLANIVRRRGYKLIRELLADSTKKEINGNADNGVAGNQDAIDDCKDTVTGQDQVMNAVVEDFSSSSEVSISETSSGSPVTDPDSNYFTGSGVTEESSVNSHNLEDCREQLDNVDDNGPIATLVAIAENPSSSLTVGSDLNSDNNSNRPLEILTTASVVVFDDSSLPTTAPVKENSSCSSNIGSDLNSEDSCSTPVVFVSVLPSDEKVLDRDQDGKEDNMAEEVSLPTKDPVTEDVSTYSNFEPTPNFDHQSYASLDSPANLSLEEKVANFVQNGDFDPLEDHVYGLPIESDAEETMEENKYGKTEEVQLRFSTSESTESVDGRDSTREMSLRTSISQQLLPSTTVDPSIRGDSSSDEELSSLSEKDLDVKTSEREDELDISNLQFMLHQKEMELFQLKEQIEREKLALSKLQTKAEAAISKAQQLVLEKDAELLAAEESLSGLVEVEIQYRGDGEIVEVTGSFNGWHHQIQMDPQPPSSIIDPVGLRKPRRWSTMLWLYPGTYEIKFIVDGQWKLDPQRESVTRGTICNNILRVDG